MGKLKYYCNKCKRNHFLDSKIGQEHSRKKRVIKKTYKLLDKNTRSLILHIGDNAFKNNFNNISAYNLRNNTGINTNEIFDISKNEYIQRRVTTGTAAYSGTSDPHSDFKYNLSAEGWKTYFNIKSNMLNIKKETLINRFISPFDWYVMRVLHDKSYPAYKIAERTNRSKDDTYNSLNKCLKMEITNIELVPFSPNNYKLTDFGHELQQTYNLILK